MKKKQTVQTVELVRDPQEEHEYQSFHQKAAL